MTLMEKYCGFTGLIEERRQGTMARVTKQQNLFYSSLTEKLALILIFTQRGYFKEGVMEFIISAGVPEQKAARPFSVYGLNLLTSITLEGFSVNLKT